MMPRLAWRNMTVDEVAVRPEARLGGALLWMVGAAVLHCLVVSVVIAGWPLVVDLLGEAVMAAAFCDYMAEGLRPSAYHRRRLPVP